MVKYTLRLVLIERRSSIKIPFIHAQMTYLGLPLGVLQD